MIRPGLQWGGSANTNSTVPAVRCIAPTRGPSSPFAPETSSLQPWDGRVACRHSSASSHSTMRPRSTSSCERTPTRWRFSANSGCYSQAARTPARAITPHEARNCPTATHRPMTAMERSALRPKLACAVQRRRFPVGARPTRRTAPAGSTGATTEETKWLKPSGKRATIRWPRECAGRNASER